MDILFVLKSLNTIHLNSPMVILLLNLILFTADKGCIIALLWCPEDKHIIPNEKADSMAQCGPYVTQNINLIAFKGIILQIRHDWSVENKYTRFNRNFYLELDYITTNRSYIF